MRPGLRRRRPASGNAVVLLYHRVGAPPADPWRLAVSPARFATHLEVIQELFQPLPLPALADAVRQRDVPRRSVAVTFDDGYRDNLHEAKPLLERFAIPATVFVVSGSIDSGRDFWWDELAQICTHARSRSLDYRELWEELRPLEHAARLDALDRLWKSVEAERPPAVGTPTAEEIVALAGGGLVEIGAHTATHPHLSELSRESQLDEVRASKTSLERLLGRKVEGFSFPHGDYGRETLECVRELGFSYACTSSARAVTSDAEPFEIPRIVVEDWSREEFARRLAAWLG